MAFETGGPGISTEASNWHYVKHKAILAAILVPLMSFLLIKFVYFVAGK